MDNEKEGFPVTAIREIKILKVLNHKNVVQLKEIVTSKASEYNHGKGSIYMVMEFSDHDLTGLTDAGTRFTTPQIKCYMKQLLEGLAYCHKNRVLHRDIKGPRPVVRSDGMWGEGAPLAARQEAGRSTPLPCARRLQPPDQQPGATEAGRFRLGEAV
jgi:cyclin-dependent kinase 12/13